MPHTYGIMLAILFVILCLVFKSAPAHAKNHQPFLGIVEILADYYKLQGVSIFTQHGPKSDLKNAIKVLNKMDKCVNILEDTFHYNFYERGSLFLNIDVMDLPELSKHVGQLLSRQSKAGQTFLVGSHDKIENIKNITFIKLYQKVYFVEITSGEVVEHYTVGKNSFQNIIGMLVNEKKGLVYRPKNDLPSFLERRSNLGGHNLQGFTYMQAPFVVLTFSAMAEIRAMKSGWMKAPDGNKYADIRHHKHLSGLFVDILGYLEQSMNFTTELLFPQEKSTRTFGSKKNGTWNGLIGGILRGQGDFLATSVTITDRRFEAVDFLQPMGTETMALYITLQGYDEKQWMSFLYPFKPALRVGLVLNSIVLVILLKLFEKMSFDWNLPGVFLWIKGVLGDLWMFLMSNLGRSPSNAYTSHHTSIRALLFCAFLASNIVFMSYRASLTAALSIRKVSLPFESIDELIDSPYRVTYIGPVDAYLSNFYSAQNALGTSEWVRLMNEKILPYGYQNRFLNGPEGINDMINSNSPTTFMYFRENVAYWVESRCEIMEAYSNNFPAQVSFAFPKYSPYTEVMNYQLLKLWENGAMGVLVKKYLMLSQHCEDSQATKTSLSMKKLISLFSILIVGMGLSAILVLLENLSWETHRRLLNIEIESHDQELTEEDTIAKLLFDYGLSHTEFDDRLDRILKNKANKNQ